MQTYGTPAFLQPELPILSNSEMPFRSILRAARTSRSLTAPHDGHTHVRSRNDRPLLMQPHSQVLEEGYHLSILRRGFNQVYKENSFQDGIVFIQESTQGLSQGIRTQVRSRFRRFVRYTYLIFKPIP